MELTMFARQIMSRFYISVPTFVALKSMESGASMRVLLKALASAEEFSSFRFRQGEKSVRPRLVAQLKLADLLRSPRFSRKSTR